MQHSSLLFLQLSRCLYSVFAALILITNVNANTLLESLEAVVQVDPSLKSAEKNHLATQENYGLAKSRLLPQIYIQGSRQQLRQTTTQDTFLGPQSKTFTGPSVNDQLVIRQGIVRPKDVMGLDLANAQTEHGLNKYKAELSDAYVRAVTAWLEVLAATQQVDFNQAMLRSVEEAAIQENKKFEKGDGTKDAMLEAKAQLENAKATVAESKEDLKSKQKNYFLLTRLPFESLELKKFPTLKLDNFAIQNKDDLWGRIQSTAPELLASKALETLQSVRIRQARTDHLPTLDLVASLNRAQNDATSTQGYRYQNTQVGVQYNIPLYAGGGVNASQRQALATYQAATADKEAMSQMLESEFNSAWAVQQGLIERVKASNSLKLSAAEMKHATDRAIFYGLKTWAEKSNAEMTLARRSVDAINVQLNFYKTQLRFLKMLPVDDPYWRLFVDRLDELSTNRNH